MTRDTFVLIARPRLSSVWVQTTDAGGPPEPADGARHKSVAMISITGDDSSARHRHDGQTLGDMTEGRLNRKIYILRIPARGHANTNGPRLRR